MWNRGKDVHAAFLFAACAAMWSRPRAPGALQAIGGTSMDGGRTNGMSKFASSLPAISPAIGRVLPRQGKTDCIEFITTGCAKIGLYGADTIDIHRTSRALGVQLP